MRKNLFALFFVLLPLMLSAQYKQSVLYDGVTGQQLITQLTDNYKPSTVLSYGDARDVLYSSIYFFDDSVRCIYTQHAVELPAGVDPIDHLIMGGSPNGINAEHAYPQSKGAGFGNARSDMHHLFPARSQVNSRRGNFPFAEINDNLTDSWFFKSFEVSDKPNTNADFYSEWRNGEFEPPEAQKGNIARAVFYFYTMYRDQADSQDANFFPRMQSTLCEWHIADPVDSLEWLRTKLISIYQSDKSNPFVLDCTIPQRTYCQGNGMQCEFVVATDNVVDAEEISLVISPNPTADNISLQFELERPASVRFRLFDTSGKTVFTNTVSLSAGVQQQQISVQHLPKGNYYLLLTADHAYGADFSSTLPFIKY